MLGQKHKIQVHKRQLPVVSTDLKISMEFTCEIPAGSWIQRVGARYAKARFPGMYLYVSVVMHLLVVLQPLHMFFCSGFLSYFKVLLCSNCC